MVKLSAYLNSMYVWTIVLLLILAIIASLSRNAFPVSLVIAILSASVFDLLLKRLYKKPLRFPFSAAITGAIIGSIAPFTASPLIVILASLVAILSKFLIRIKGFNIFNPATLGLLVSLALFSLGDEWWVAVSYNFLGFSIILTPLLILANYKAMKLRTSLSFLLVISILYSLTGFVNVPYTSEGAISFLYSLPYYFAFIMVSEPKTSPYRSKEQIIFGISVAVLLFIFMYYSIPYSFFISLLLGNLGYALYRIRALKNR